MKVVVISASPHEERSNTFCLAQEVLEGVQEHSVTVDIIHLAKCNIGFCNHCDTCHKKILNCSVKDSVALILRKMIDADGIILASPNYISQVTGSMKTLFDRSSHFIHCKRLLGKYVLGVVSSGSGYNNDVLSYIKFYAHTCGAQYSGGVSSGIKRSPQVVEDAVRLGAKLVADIREQKQYPDQIENIEQGRQRFKQIVNLRRNDWSEEYQYWRDKAWI